MKTENKTKREASASTSNTPWMVTLPKASKMTGIPIGHLRKIIKNGELKYYRAGDRYYVWVKDLEDALRGYGASR